MRALLDNKFAPITFTFGFVEGSFDQVSRAFVLWQDRVDDKFDTRTEHKKFEAPLTESLLALEPLATPLDRYLLTETRSNWCALFANGLRTNDVNGPVSYLPTVLGGRGLEIACIPDRSDCTDKEGVQIYGAVKFVLYGHYKTDWLNRVRNISVTNDVNGWEFTSEGSIQSYEQTGNYQKRNIRDRLTCEILESYCKALNIELFSSGHYGGRCLLSHRRRPIPSASTASISEARSHLCI